MFYYPLSTLMLMGIKEILIIVAPKMLPVFESHFGTGSTLGISIEYVVQSEPRGLPDAFILGENFVGDKNVTLILGDNLLHGTGLGRHLKEVKNVDGALITTYQVANPQDYGVISFDEKGKIRELIEKPKALVSNWAIPGLYCFDNSVIARAKTLAPSRRGELEIVDLLRTYLDEQKLSYLKLERGTAWLDMGNPKALLEASNFVNTIQDRQGLALGDPFEVA
jgi:glucose-1-phosphate thymidylyltransferase